MNEDVPRLDARRLEQAAVARRGSRATVPRRTSSRRSTPWSIPRRAATIDDVVAHVEHVREVAGVDHIGLGGDYDGVGELPAGLEDVTGYPRLLAALADRGWSDEDLGRSSPAATCCGPWGTPGLTETREAIE